MSDTGDRHVGVPDVQPDDSPDAIQVPPDGIDEPVNGAVDDDAPIAIPLLIPSGPVAGPIVDHTELREWATRLAEPGGPVAIDAERASGFRYGSRAYLVQLRRPDIGTALIDPIPLGDLSVLDEPLAESEWVLHAANQDLPCLAEVGIRPRRLFDTELAGRLAGLPRVGLGPLVEQMLGFHLRKGHGAADWSTRPLPQEWLTYAALDVEVLVELRDAMEAELIRQGKLEWAHQEFAAILTTPPSPPRIDPWRRTSGMHRITDRRALAVIRELWTTRDALARRRDVAPHRILPDSAIIAAAVSKPATAAALTALPVFSGRMQRRSAAIWLSAIGRALALPAEELPVVRPPGDGPPPPAKWASRDPAAAARLQAARGALAELSERVGTPVENLVSPDVVRRILWTPPDDSGGIARALADRGSRPWQIELTARLLAAALNAGVVGAPAGQVTGQ
ncbi:HRDC domain-containing protein [Nakamurella sp. GG22]